MTRAKKKKLRLLILEIAMFLMGLVYIYPVFLMFMNSVKPFKEVVTDVIALPTRVAWENYEYVIDKMEYGRLFINNAVITAIGIIGIVAFSSISAYILDRRKNKYTKLIHTIIITPMLIPFQTIR